MSNGKALMVLGLVVVLVGAYLGVAAWLRIGEYWAGFLFLLQWSMMEEMKLERLSRSATGAAAGAALPFVPIWLAPVVGAEAGLAVMLALILIAVFLLIRGVATFVVNAATMIFLTVVSIPHLAGRVPPGDIFAGLLLGVVFFGGLAALAGSAAKLRARRAATS